METFGGFGTLKTQSCKEIKERELFRVRCRQVNESSTALAFYLFTWTTFYHNLNIILLFIKFNK